MNNEKEYVSSVTLMILGENLNPDMVTAQLSLTPSRAWCKGEQKSFVRSNGSKCVFDSRHEWGGWKCFIDQTHENALLEKQLQFWCDTLRDRVDAIARLKSKGMHCALSLFVTMDDIASIILTAELQVSLASLGLELELSIMADDASEQKIGQVSPEGAPSDEPSI